MNFFSFSFLHDFYNTILLNMTGHLFLIQHWNILDVVNTNQTSVEGQIRDQISNKGFNFLCSFSVLDHFNPLNLIEWQDAHDSFSFLNFYWCQFVPSHPLKANCHYLNAPVCLSLSGCRERCGVIKIRQGGVQKHWRERETVFQNGPAGLRRLTRKRYIDLGNERKHTDYSLVFTKQSSLVQFVTQ